MTASSLPAALRAIDAHGYVLRGHLVPGNWGDSRTYQDLAEVRTVITSWAALTWGAQQARTGEDSP
jgi:hypothetical protein